MIDIIPLTSTHLLFHNVRQFDEVLIAASPGSGFNYNANTYLGNPDIVEIYVKTNANNVISANVSANLYVVFNMPVAFKASGNTITINLANTAGGNTGVARYMGGRANTANNTANIANIYNIDNIDKFNDIDCLASLITSCDLIVTSSNATAHIAGALGVKTLLLAPFGKGKIWYWYEENQTSLWYPSIKVFNQLPNSSWENAVREIKNEIEKKIT